MRWVTLAKEIVWYYPRDVRRDGPDTDVLSDWPHANDISDVSDLLREYVDTPREQLLEREFANDRWGLADVLRAADRRIGLRGLRKVGERVQNPAVWLILARRGVVAGEREPVE